MHKPSVFLAVCQCERGGGSCRSGPGLNDGAHNLCFARRWLCELWLILLMLPYSGIRWEMVSVVGPPAHQVARTAESERRKTDSGRAWGKLNERTEWMRERRKKWGDGQKVCAETRRERKVYGWWVLCVSEWGSGALCASQSVAQWVRLSGAGAKDEGQRARRERWGQPAGLKRVEAWEKKEQEQTKERKIVDLCKFRGSETWSFYDK